MAIKDDIKVLKDAFNSAFGISSSEAKKAAEAGEAAVEGLKAGLRSDTPVIDELSGYVDTDTVQENGTDSTEREWVWVNGYKGMDKNMQCWNGFQYELGYQYDMGDDEEIEACCSGYHLCLNMEDVFGYVKLGNGNRFFEVRAMVRKKDLDKYGTYMNSRYYGLLLDNSRIDKLAAKSIEIVRELSIDEIMEHVPEAAEWCDEYKKMAITTSVKAVQNLIKIDELTKLGYSNTFAHWLVNRDKYGIAKAVGSQEGLSMDMKVFYIMNNI